ncbi:hypothetical protein FNF31_06126 [Cafeteria roenbergensis]|uniref:Galactose oxidase n=1 Tax=Cafeteria roenbergensis TaxID=33653 RepID=A0A5A8E3A2_CAFRO|nr:hypothetical protein FNF31_06126 [Cafeteria roenbergensis]KAA0171307.1 hypothetical protein FNF28_00798 [Cafeteria roenbergensis]
MPAPGTAHTMLLVLGALAAAEATPSPVWRQGQNTTSLLPSARLGMAATALDGGSGLLVHGGCSSSCCYAPLGDLWAFVVDPSSGAALLGQWKQLPAADTAPSGRLYHSMTPIPAASSGSAGATAALIAGSNAATGFLSDVWLLPTSGLSGDGAAPAWTQLQPSPALPPRAGHTATLISGAGATFPALLVAGGRNVVDVLADSWILVASGDPSAGPEDWTWAWRQVSDAGFKGLVNHVATAVTLRPSGGAVRGRPDGSDRPTHVVVVGGTDGLGQDSTLAYQFDIAAGRWGTLDAAGDVLGARHGGVGWGVPSAPNSMLVFGGQRGIDASSLYLGDLVALTSNGGSAVGVQRLQNSTYSSSAGRPIARVNAAGAGGAHGLWLFGGFSGYGGGLDDNLHNDVWLLTI